MYFIHLQFVPQVATLFLFLCCCDKGSSLVWSQFSVPDWVKVGENAQLICEFDLLGDELYSVKWYKAEREIYRYVPKATPIQMAFTMPGVNIDEKKSDDQHLVLKKVDFSSSGRYKCEILSDGPYFKTLVKSEVLQVVDLPQGSPILTGTRQEYQLGELINITCSTTPSVPPASLTWYINDREATPSELAPRSYYHYNPLDITHPVASSRRLEIIAQPRYFHHGLITLLCRAKIEELHDSRVLHTARESSGLRPSLLEGHTGGVSAVAATALALYLFSLFCFHVTFQTSTTLI